MSAPAISIETDRYLTNSCQVKGDDIDWNQAREAGLTPNERFVLTYFADIESQTIVYLRDLLRTRAGLDPDVIAFLSMWNYEEFFHGRLLGRLMKECGYPLEENQIARVRRRASLSEWIESLGATVISWIFDAEFPAVYTAWGAIQEITTLRGYEEIIRTTANPVLKLLCERIAKQERRHFAWYFNNARDRLAASSRARWLTRHLLDRFWSPVGAGVKSKQEVARLFSYVFRGERATWLAHDVDSKISRLPGLEGLTLMANYVKKQVEPFMVLEHSEGSRFITASP